LITAHEVADISSMGSSRTRKRSAVQGPVATNAKELSERLQRGTDALRREFTKVHAAIAKLRTQGSEAFDELYETVGRVLTSNPPLYLGGGYRTAQEFIDAELPGETLRSVQRNVLVARCFSPEEEARHGITFLEEVAGYARELSGAAEPPAAINLDRLMLTLPGPSGTAGKKARDATIEDVRKARRLLRAGGTKHKAAPAEVILRSALGKNKALAQIGLRVGTTSASFTGVPLEALALFAGVLAHVKLPAATVPATAAKERAPATRTSRERATRAPTAKKPAQRPRAATKSTRQPRAAKKASAAAGARTKTPR
jgi:hypothetical protein